MKKQTVRACTALAVLLIVYHVIVFAVPFAKTAVFWLSYVFTLAAFAVAAASVYIVFCKTPDVKSKFYGFPIAKIGVIYAIGQIAVGLVFMAVGKWLPWWLALVIYIVALGVAAIGLISAEVVVEEIARQDEKLKKDVTLMRSLQSKVNQLAGQCDDLDAAEAVEAFADEIRYADPVTNDDLAEVEADLSAVVDELQKAVVDGDAESIRKLCRMASAVLAERHRLCKLGK